MKQEYWETCRQAWQQYAPNLTKENFVGGYGYTPLDISRRIINMLEGGCRQGSFGYGQYYYGRPMVECSDYRTPISKFYLCGSSSHPGGAITFAPGYNAASVIAEDLGLKKWCPPFASWRNYLTG